MSGASASRPLATSGMALALLAAATLAAHAAEAVFPAGSRIGLVPPNGMVASRLNPAFEDADRGVLIAVNELDPRTYDRVAREFSVDELTADGMTVLSREPAERADASGFLVIARQTVSGTPIRKWALVLRAPDLLAIVVALVPESAAGAYSDGVMRAALASVEFRPKPAQAELLAALPYRLDDLAGFRLLEAHPNGIALLTDGPVDTTRPADQPIIMVLLRPSEPVPGDPALFARRALAGFIDPARFRTLRSEPIRIGGQAGFEIVGTSQDPDGAATIELTHVQWLRFAPGALLQVLAAARTERWAEVYPRMRAVRDGIGPR